MENSLKATNSVTNPFLVKFYNFFASIGASCIRILKNTRGKVKPQIVESWRLALFVFLRLNLYVKIVFLLSLFWNHNDSLDLLTKLGLGIWIVISGVTLYSDYYFAQAHPLFELLCAFWNFQGELAVKLSAEDERKFRDTLRTTAKRRISVHTFCTLSAMFSVALQYMAEPKALMFTGSLISFDSVVIDSIMWIHEELVLVSLWFQGAFIMMLPVLVSRDMTTCLEFLKIQVDRLEDSAFGSQTSNSLDGEDKGSEYMSIDQVFTDYRKLEMVSDRLRSITSFLSVLSQIIYSTQITFDVYVGVQLFHLGDYLSLLFYAVDCMLSLGYWTFALISMGKLDDMMSSFCDAINTYFVRSNGRRYKYNARIWKSFKDVKVYIGPKQILKGTVTHEVFELLNYYILAAMWG